MKETATHSSADLSPPVGAPAATGTSTNAHVVDREIDVAAMTAMIDALFERMYDKAYTVARKLSNHAKAEDAIQAVFLRLWKRAMNPAGKPIPVELERQNAMVLRGVVNELSTMSRARKRLRVRAEAIRQDALDVAHAWMDPAAPVGPRRVAQLLDEAIQLMPPRCREVFVAVRLGDCSYAEVSITFGISVSTVHQHLSKGNAIIRTYFAPYQLAGGEGWIRALCDEEQQADEENQQ